MAAPPIASTLERPAGAVAARVMPLPASDSLAGLDADYEIDWFLAAVLMSTPAEMLTPGLPRSGQPATRS